MLEPPLPSDEAQRLAALYTQHILDTPAEARFDRITRLAARIFAVPIALISLSDSDRQWVKSCYGGSITAIPPAESLRAHMTRSADILVIPDLQQEPHFAEHPLVQSAPEMRFYAACPLYSADGRPLGALCLLDQHLRSLCAEDLQTLRDLAAWAEQELNTVALATTLRAEVRERHCALVATAQRQAQELTLLDRVRTALARELDLASICRTVVEAIGASFGYRQVSLYLRHDDWLILQHQVGYDSASAQIPLSQGITGRVVSTGQPILIRDVRAEPEFSSDAAEIISALYVPISDQGQIIGVLHVASAAPEPLTEADLQPMLAVSKQVALAADRARLYTALQEREQQYRSVVDYANDVMFQTDPAGVWTFLNPAWTALTGFSCDASRSHTFIEYVHPDDQAQVAAVFCSLNRRTRDEYRFEVRCLTNEGGTRWLDVQLRPRLAADGAVIGSSGTLTDLTPYKLTMEMLRASEERFRQLTEHIREVVFLADPLHNQMLYISPAYETIWGRSCVSAYEQPFSFLDAVHPDDREQVQRDVARSMNEEAGDWEGRIVRPNGSIRWVRARTFAIYDDDGAIARLAGITEDITERKQAELEIRRLNAELEQRVVEATAELTASNTQLANEIAERWQVEQRYRQLFEEAPVMYVITYYQDGEPIVVDCNQIFVQTLGYSHTEVIGRPLAAFYASQSYDPKLGRGAGYEPQAHPVDQERDLITRDGRVVKTLLRAIPETGPDGQITGIRKMFVDITMRKQAEIALGESEERYRRLVERSPAPIIVHSAGKFVYVNPAAVALLAANGPEDLIGTSILDIVHPDYRGLVQARVHDVVTTGTQSALREQQFIRLDGQIIDVEVTGIPILESGRPAVQAVIRDITAHKQAAAALEKERALLAQRVAERTADLRAANAELARTARLKDEFLASMSHELRTPLTTILGMAETLQEGVYGLLSREQAGSLRTIEESGRHLLALINDILDLSKVEAGKLELEIDTVPVAAICEASMRLVKQAALKKQIRLSFANDGAVIVIQADARRLKQILVNLLANAIKFTPAHGAVGLEVVGDAVAQVVRLTVWDTGIGIAPGDLERLFQPFVQLDSSLAREHTGTGLGLALVARMLDLHGGSIAVESTLGQGSRFTVTLPWRTQINTSAADGSERGADTIATAPPDQQQTAANADPAVEAPLILLADDDAENRSMLTTYIQRHGYRVISAQNGREVIEQARSAQPDLILMDIQMPGIDGIEATRQIRAEARLGRIPIIALTALAMLGDRERCLAAGANAYLSKPVRLRSLIQAIATQLQPR